MKTKKNTKKSKSLLKKGDTVIAIAGNEKGQTGTILSRKGDRILVQGLNVRKKHVKKSEANPQGGVVELERPVHISNLRLCIEDKPVKLKVKLVDSDSKELYYVDNGKEVKYRSL